MPYTMVTTAGLGFDLARRPAGPQVATVLRTALACDADDLRRLALRARRPGQGAGPARPHDPHRVVDHVGAAGHALGLAQDGHLRQSAQELHRLEVATLGDLDALERFVRCEVLDWATRDDADVPATVVAAAADVLCDAAVAGFGDDVSAAQRRRLCAGFVGARLTLRDEHVATGHQAVDDLLRSLATTDAAGRRRWREATDRLRPRTTDWAPAFHQATWAAHLSDRLRLAADAQLAGVQAFRAGGFDVRDAAYGVWNAVSGALQAMAVADLVGEEHLEALLAVQRLATEAD